MAQVGAPHRDPIPIGEAAKPPFARLADPRILFAQRGERFRTLAHRHELKSYLLFLADLCAAQHVIQEGLPAPELPAAAALARAHGMPPIDRDRLASDTACHATLGHLLDALGACNMPAAAAAALIKVRSADPGTVAVMMRSVLANSVAVESMAEHVFVAAALQVHAARIAAQLDAASLVPVGERACPACGGPPVSSMVVGWLGAHGTRFCACAICATMWNYVRIKCTVCGSTKGISYQEVEGGPGTIKAECCSECGSYVKILYEQKDHALDPVADDVASLGLDLLMRETGLRRGGVDHFLLGY